MTVVGKVKSIQIVTMESFFPIINYVEIMYSPKLLLF